MFCVRVVVRVKPAGRERFLSQLKTEEREVPERFDGCERFAVFSDPADPDNLLLYEEWSTRAAAERYLNSDYFQEARKVLFPLIDGAPDSAYYQAERTGP